VSGRPPDEKRTENFTTIYDPDKPIKYIFLLKYSLFIAVQWAVAAAEVWAAEPPAIRASLCSSSLPSGNPAAPVSFY
jgi:hypothetical protein